MNELTQRLFVLHANKEKNKNTSIWGTNVFYKPIILKKLTKKLKHIVLIY
ncbi:hypothetical protein RICGR_0542 [Rickettsiella grylli]|uniref:Uncharacterized protein n=1 Tax=Rickettsiella grylli TaxID=59196 RepID=A8PLU9_9COXI|nr:hypothetical protein RICGR_0542 [Rickettsiella grylli]